MSLLGRIKPDWYLIFIIGAGVLASLLPARGDAAIWLGWLTKIAIALVFFLHGARLSREAVVRGVVHWRLHLAILAATFVVFPALTVGLVLLPAWITPPELAAGLILLGCLPSTIQSSIAFVSIARGNVPAAVASASASNLIGVFLTPLLAGLLMRTEGAINPGSFWTIIVQLLLPFVLGQVARPWVGGVMARHGKFLGALDRGTIVFHDEDGTPTEVPVTPGPTDSTTPAWTTPRTDRRGPLHPRASRPGFALPGGKRHPRIRASPELTVVARTRTTTWPLPATGSGTSRTETTSGGPYRSTTAAFTTTPTLRL